MASINVGREIVERDLRYRMNQLERGATPACPECYLVGARRKDGRYPIVKDLMPEEPPAHRASTSA